MGKTKHPLKIAIYSPYLDIFGGGERYILTIAEMLSRKHEVYFYADGQIRDNASKKFNICLDRIHFITNNLFRANNLFTKLIELRSYDVFFYMTDGGLFFSSAKKNFIIIQSPAHLPEMNIINKLKFINWKILCYSTFMQNIIKKHLKKQAVILSPCINTDQFKTEFSAKDNIILSVGRFFKKPHDKKQNILIEIFKKYYSNNFAFCHEVF